MENNQNKPLVEKLKESLSELEFLRPFFDNRDTEASKRGIAFDANKENQPIIKLKPGEKECKSCGRIYTSIQGLKKHRSGLDPNECCICNTSFVTKAKLRIHIFQFRKNPEVLCCVCDGKFTSAYDRVIHQKSLDKVCPKRYKLY